MERGSPVDIVVMIEQNTPFSIVAPKSENQRRQYPSRAYRIRRGGLKSRDPESGHGLKVVIKLG